MSTEKCVISWTFYHSDEGGGLCLVVSKITQKLRDWFWWNCFQTNEVKLVSCGGWKHWQVNWKHTFLAISLQLNNVESNWCNLELAGNELLASIGQRSWLKSKRSDQVFRKNRPRGPADVIVKLIPEAIRQSKPCDCVTIRGRHSHLALQVMCYHQGAPTHALVVH